MKAWNYMKLPDFQQSGATKTLHFWSRLSIGMVLANSSTANGPGHTIEKSKEVAWGSVDQKHPVISWILGLLGSQDK